jgi:hypothetical protein
MERDQRQPMPGDRRSQGAYWPQLSHESHMLWQRSKKCARTCQARRLKLSLSMFILGHWSLCVRFMEDVEATCQPFQRLFCTWTSSHVSGWCQGAAKHLALLPQHGTGSVLLDMASGKAGPKPRRASFVDLLGECMLMIVSVQICRFCRAMNGIA